MWYAYDPSNLDYKFMIINTRNNKILDIASNKNFLHGFHGFANFAYNNSVSIDNDGGVIKWSCSFRIKNLA